MAKETCNHEDACDRPVFRAGLCRTHYWRSRNGGPSGPIQRYESPRARVLAAAVALADADAENDEAYERAEWRFWRAVRAWTRAKSRRRKRAAGTLCTVGEMVA